MKIAILGYSGSGKSTLARAIAKKTGIACLHLDSVHFLPGWVEKADEQARTEVQAFLTAHADWVIDGNYPALCRAERLAAAEVKNVSLTNFDVIAAVAAEQNYIKHEDIDRLIQFRNDPADESWIGGTK